MDAGIYVFRVCKTAAFLRSLFYFLARADNLLGSELIPPIRRTPSKPYCSMSGLAQFVAARGLATLQEWCEEGYSTVRKIDEELSGKMKGG